MAGVIYSDIPPDMRKVNGHLHRLRSRRTLRAAQGLSLRRELWN
jgi:hypothetical protein